MVKGLIVVPINYDHIKAGRKTQKRQPIEYKVPGGKVALPNNATLKGIEDGKYIFTTPDERTYAIDPPHKIGEYLYLRTIEMTKRSAKVFLQVTDISVEHLRDITDEDIQAEGVPSAWPMPPLYCKKCSGRGFLSRFSPCPHCATPLHRFCNYWEEKIQRKWRPEITWDSNPLVWKITYQKVPPLRWVNGEWIAPCE